MMGENLYSFTSRRLRKGEVDWSETAVEYTLYLGGHKVKTEMCEEHLMQKYIDEDIRNYKLELSK